jgi:hypothetical protein
MASGKSKEQQRRKAQRELQRSIRRSEVKFPGLLSIVNGVAIQHGQLLRRSDGKSLTIEEEIVWGVARGLLYGEEDE